MDIFCKHAFTKQQRDGMKGEEREREKNKNKKKERKKKIKWVGRVGVDSHICVHIYGGSGSHRSYSLGNNVYDRHEIKTTAALARTLNKYYLFSFRITVCGLNSDLPKMCIFI